MQKNKEVIICKFDNEIECSSYLCEEDCSELEMYYDMGKKCPLFEREQKLWFENKKLKSWVYCQCKEPDYNKFCMDNMCARCRKPIENHPLSLEIPRKEELTCDKSKEPPCHLEPSVDLCKKCPLNKTPKVQDCKKEKEIQP